MANIPYWKQRKPKFVPTICWGCDHISEDSHWKKRRGKGEPEEYKTCTKFGHEVSQRCATCRSGTNVIPMIKTVPQLQPSKTGWEDF